MKDKQLLKENCHMKINMGSENLNLKKKFWNDWKRKQNKVYLLYKILWIIIFALNI